MIKNIILDVGKVILDFKPMLPCLRIAENEEDANILFEAIFNSENWGKKIDAGLISEDDYLKECIARLPDERLINACTQILEQWHLDALFPMRGVEEFIKQLLDYGYNLYILSNFGERFYQSTYKIPYYNSFSGRVVSFEDKVVKPDPTIYANLLSRYNLNPVECFFVDDLQDNINIAQTFGIMGHCFLDGDFKRLKARLGLK